MIYHMIAFGLGFCLDLLLGDPYWLPHPIRVIGNFIGILEKRMNKKECSEKYLVRAGIGMVALVLLTVLMVTALLLILAYRIHPVAGVILEMIMTYQILAAKCLKVESMKVYNCLKENDLIAARHAVSMIVGRDTGRLDETGVAKAAIETVAENTSDGVIAPMLYTALGGPVLGFFYKAVNTMDATEVNVHIEEDFTTPSDPKPGDQISKKPRVVNDSNVNCYVRMRVNVTNEDLLDPISVNSGWTLKSDGFYYWNSVLKPGEKTGNLFENVRIKSDALKEGIHDLDVLVYAEAVQAGSNSADSAWATMD